nr:integrase, catalytic region, zinc finger, CCHC-type, peptidase aspartic, catalytic [Tanacetum cinerariifolium]
MYDMILQECMSNEVMCSYLLSFSDLDALAELQCLYLHKVKEYDYLAQKLSKQTKSISKEVHTKLLQRFDKVEKHLISLEIALQKNRCMKHMTGNLKLLCNFVEKFLGTVRFGNDQFAPIMGYGDLVQGNITINMVYYVEGLNHNLFSVGQFCDADLEVAFRISTCFVRDLQGNDLLTDAHVPSQQELDLLFDPLYDEFFTAGSSSVIKSSSPINNSNQQDTQPTANIQPTSAPSTPTFVHAEGNNDNQAEEEHLQDDEFTNPFYASVQEIIDSSSHNNGNSNVPTFNQP